MANKKKIFHWVFTILWLLIGAGTIVLLAAAVKRKDAQKCTSVSINIEGVDNNFFVDKKDILNSIATMVNRNPVGETISAFDLREMENELKKDVWVKTTQMFFDNNNRLMVNVLEREPLARVFTTKGTTFYVDSSLAMLPLSEKFSARLPVFTGFPSNKGLLSKPDSTLLKGILAMSIAIQKDTFRTAIVDQIDITPQRNFLIIPKVGNNIIMFGDASFLDEKFAKLQLFYQQVVVKAGWNKYSEVNLQYYGQIVAKRKGTEDKSIDSLRTLQLMQAIADNAEKQAGDSLQLIVQDNENNTTNINLVQESMERDDGKMVEHETGHKAFPIVAVPIAAVAVIAKKLIVNTKKPVILPAVKRGKTTPKTALVKTSPVKKQEVKVNKAAVEKPRQVYVKPAINALTKKIEKPKVKPLIKKQDLTKPINEY